MQRIGCPKNFHKEEEKETARACEGFKVGYVTIRVCHREYLAHSSMGTPRGEPD